MRWTLQKKKEKKGLGEGDSIEQVIKDVFKEKNDDRGEEEKKLVKEVPKRETWLSWWKKQWTGADDRSTSRS